VLPLFKSAFKAVLACSYQRSAAILPARPPVSAADKFEEDGVEGDNRPLYAHIESIRVERGPDLGDEESRVASNVALEGSKGYEECEC
jgi:hypothetical protein